MSRPACICLALLAPLLVSCERRPASDLPTDVWLITVDTFRVDRAGCAGNPAGLTPTLDRMLRSGRLASNARVPAPLTAPSHASILTGLEPPSHGVRDNGTHSLPDDMPTLAAWLSREGFHTLGVIGAFPLDARFGFGRGFERFDSDVGPAGTSGTYLAERSASEVANRALELVASVPISERVFLWTHFFDPHHPRTIRRALRRLPVADDYDREIRQMDFEIARLRRDFLTARGREPIVAIISDHGEGLGDHGESSHGLLTYEPTMRALFGVAAPAGSAERARLEPGIETRVVRNSDLFPTLLDLLNLPYDVSGFDGASLLDVADPAGGAYGESYFPLFHYGWSPLLTWRDDRWSYVEGGYAELFDIVADPAETHNVLDAHPDVARTLAARLHAIARDPSDEPAKTMDTETREKLEALGYVGSGSTPTVDRTRDPRDLIEIANDLFRGIDLIGKGDPRGAAPFLERAVAADPNNVTALFHLADCYRQVGRPRAAMEHYRRAIECDPRAPVAYGHLAFLEYETGDTDEAFAVLDAGLSVDPDAFPLLMTSADIHAAEGHVDQARTLYERALELERDRVEPYVGLASLAETQGDRDEAGRRWAQALAINPSDPHIPASVRDASASR